MYKYKKLIINIITLLFIAITIIELIKYLLVDNTIFGLYYLLVCLLIIFLLVPCAYNYKKYFSKARISKLIIIVLFIIFDSFILEKVLFNSISYMDSSKEYIKSIFIYKNILKTILAIILTIFTIFEFKLEEVIKRSISTKSID